MKTNLSKKFLKTVAYVAEKEVEKILEKVNEKAAEKVKPAEEVKAPVKVAKEKGLGEDVKFYLEFFKYGCPPHGGFAIGVDRLTMLLLDLPSLKESMFLFRGPNRLNP